MREIEIDGNVSSVDELLNTCSSLGKDIAQHDCGFAFAAFEFPLAFFALLDLLAQQVEDALGLHYQRR